MNYLRAVGSIFLVSIAIAIDAFAQTGTGLTKESPTFSITSFPAQQANSSAASASANREIRSAT